MHCETARRWGRRRIGARLSVIAVWIASIGAGCEEGELEDAADARAPRDGARIVPRDRIVSTDMDVRSADGAHRCGFFPDTCPTGANCYSVRTEGELGRRCLAYDSGSVGEDCTEGRLAQCGDGRRCFDGTCRALCDPTGSQEFNCESGDVCIVARTGNGRELPWGVCRTRSDECRLWPSDDCPEGENCYSVQRGTRCLTYDPEAESGEECAESTDCDGGQVCVRERGDGSSVCRNKCDDDHPCETGTCEPISELEFGACFRGPDAG
jgi:hypothetical protein